VSFENVTEDFFNPQTLEWDTKTNWPYSENDVVRRGGRVFVARRAAWLEPPEGLGDGVTWFLTPVGSLPPEDFAALCRHLAEAG
jgi:hypothetical protein